MGPEPFRRLLPLLSLCVVVLVVQCSGRIVPGSVCHLCMLRQDLECVRVLRCPMATGPFQLIPLPLPLDGEGLSPEEVLALIRLEHELLEELQANMCTYCKQTGDYNCTQRWCF